MAEIVLCPLLQVVFEKLASRFLKEIAGRCGFKDEIKKLQRALRAMQAVLQDAEERQATDKNLKLWLSELKEVAFDADDLLEEFGPEAMLQENDNSLTEQVSNIVPSLRPFMTYLTRFPELKQIRERLDVLLEERSSFKLKKRDADEKIKNLQKRETGSFVIESEVIGREEDKENIVEMLLSTTERRANEVVSVIPLVGLGGLGKTTLAQLVYNDERVMRNFELRMWVCVNDDFDVRKILNLMIESATRRRCDDLLGMDVLQSQLRDLLVRRRYLLVLDDVWNEDADEWEKLKILLKFGAEGSKVIVTTRSAKVATIMGTVSSHHLKGLSHDDCWALFKQRAFAHDQEDYPDLLPIGKQIVKKCGGVPLAAKTLGSLMRFKREPEEWLSVQENELWNVCEEETGILPALKLSYSHLPSHLKGCFMYCSIFPKNYVIKKEKLIHLWIAEGLIESCEYPMRTVTTREERKSLENVGSNYFNDLMWTLFFEEVKKNSDGDVIECKMHDLVHDLAKSVAGEEFFIFERDCLPKNLSRVRYMSLVCHSESCTIPEALYEAKKLRTLIFLFPKGGSGEVPADLFSHFRNLRVLDLGYSGIKRLQSTVSCLKHLRYLGLSNTFVATLPETISSLYNLQVLNLSGCADLTRLPRDLARMCMLRHLIINNCERLPCLPDDIGALFLLQTLPIFIVSNESDDLRQLKRLRLRGELTIRNLENVKEEVNAVISKMKFLHSLELSWGDEHDGLNLTVRNDFAWGLSEKVLDCLQPPENLKRLSIKRYSGIHFPRWMSTLALPNLTKIELINCKRCEHLPSFGRLPVLEIIHMQGMEAVKNIGSEFYGEYINRSFASLKELSLIDFPNLEFWWSMSGGAEFPSLVKLTINKCPRLMNMPQLSSLRHLDLQNCHETILRSAVNVTSLSVLIISVFTGQLIVLDNLLQNNVHLMSLTISSCPKLHRIPPSLGNLVSLKSLTIRWCEELLSLPQQLQNLTCLQSLEISECHSLSTLPQSIDRLISLKYLSIENCSNLRSLPIELQHLGSLEHLTIMYCPRLVSLPTDWHNLSMLRSLCLLSCPELSSLPESIKHVTALQNLEIHGCPGLNVLPEWVANLSLLRSLAISDCPNMTSLPEGLECLSTLQRLSIQECPRLEQHCKKNIGKDWPKIAHIAHVYIGSPELRKENVASSSLR
ncbi:PREDICTED: putative disease resistance protein RGA3 [Theobroma cacao]|uniref:Disease resistance protein RGA3 n=1 Tax=Theobroma cacao TaxID=3641 RepID=A0AB32WR23_THECC|nr:PREDICTED: putative disease resistance protein RGA3 [Theobroma cacao]XP_017981186.1 PREDICTED: putative disease resistance protein RGA3 [Theobroma cacao]